MLSIFKRFMKGKANVLSLPAPVVATGAGVRAEWQIELQKDLDAIDRMSLEDATREWAAANRELRQAQENFDKASELISMDTAVVALNAATLRVDNASRRMRHLLGLPVRPVEEAVRPLEGVGA